LDTEMDRLGRSARIEHLRAAAVLALMLLCFLWTPIRRHGDAYLSAADLLQDFSLLKVEPGHVSGNALLSDSVTEMQPWREFTRDELAAGRFPLWNPLNGTGCPHFANYQSAVASPFSIPYYLFDTRTALIAVSFLKLFSLGFLTYLFLRQIRLGFAAALLGGTAFMFSGHNVLLLTFPHVGALVVLPGGCLFVERALQRHLEGRRCALELVGLALVVLTGALAGNPEPFYFGMLLAGAYAVARLAGTWLELRRAAQARRPLWPLACALLAATLLAVGMASFQMLPFLEYLANSHVFEQRSSVQTPLDPHFWPLAMVPNILGNPASPYILDYAIPPPNFELVNTAHINGFVAFLALLAGLLVRRNRYARFFWIAAALWACYAYDLLGASRWFALLPTLDMAPMNRSQGIWLFCLACLAAIFVDELVRRREERAWRGALLLLLAALAFLFVHLEGAERLIAEYADVPSPNHDKFEAYVPGRIAVVTRCFALGVLLATALLLLRGARPRALLALGFLPLVFFPTGWHWRNYEPVCEERLFFAETAALHELKAAVGEERVAILGEDSIPPMSNLAWRVNLLANYDGIWVRDFDALYRVLFGDTYNWRPIVKGSERALQLTATPWVLAKWNWIFLDNGLSQLQRSQDSKLVRHEILPGQELGQSFKCFEDGLQAVVFYLSANPEAPNREYLFRLRALEDGELVCEQRISTDEIRATIHTHEQRRFPLDRGADPLGREVVFRFPPLPRSRGQIYEATLSSADAQPGEGVFGWSFTLRAYGGGEARSGSAVLPGESWFDFSCRQDRYELVKQIGDYGLFRCKSALPVFHAVGGAVHAADEKECLTLLRAPLFDPQNMVVLIDTPDPGTLRERAASARDAGRLIKLRDSVRIYYVLDDGRSMVWIENEATFLANKFRWEAVETVAREEFERFEIVQDDPELARRLGLNTVAAFEPDGSTPELLEQSPTSYRMRITREQPGWLVISQARYPGWKARIGGVETPLLRANYAFNAIELPRGTSEIEFVYEPASFRLGLLLSAASALIGLLLLQRFARG
jgi:Bacterial membrane protein YfhO